MGISTGRPVGSTPGNIQSMRWVWVKRTMNSSTTELLPTVRLTGASTMSGGFTPMKWFA